MDIPATSSLNDSFLCNVFEVNTAHIFMEFEPQSFYQPNKFIYIKNISEIPQEVFVDFPLTGYFSVDYCIPRGKLMPCKSVEMEIKCMKNLEMRPHYDRMIVKCSRGCGLFIKITANPIHNSAIKIPNEINMGTVPLGEIATAKLVLPPVQRGMPFIVLCSSCSPELDIRPMKGTVEEKPVEIEISYKPSAYVTVSYPVHIYLPTLSSLPYFLTVTADSKPGFIGQLISNAAQNAEIPEPTVIHKIPKSKLPKAVNKQIPCRDKDTLWSHHKTNIFLIKKDKEEISPDELLGPLGRPFSTEENIKKAKQDNFLKEVEKMKKEQAEALIRKTDFILKSPSADRSMWDLRWSHHEQEKNGYSSIVYDMKEPTFLNRRPIFPISKDPDPTFTDKHVNPWFVRFRALKRFIDAARTIVVQNRLLKRLEILKNMTDKDIETIEKKSAVSSLCFDVTNISKDKDTSFRFMSQQ